MDDNSEVNAAKEMNIPEETVRILVEQSSGFPKWDLKLKKNVTVSIGLSKVITIKIIK